MEKRSKKLFLSSLSLAALYLLFIGAALNPSLPSPKNPIYFYSNQNRDDLSLILKKIFSKAYHHIEITMYALTDGELLKRLHERAEKGVAVKISYDPSSGSTDFQKPLIGNPIKTRGLMHRKIVVVDDSYVFIGSANMTTSSLVHHDNLTVGLYNPPLAKFLRSPHSSCFEFTQGILWLLPDPYVLNFLKEKLSSAKSSIFVAMFTLTHPDLLTTLCSVHDQGIDVTVAVDHYAARGASRKAVQHLQSHGVKVIFSQGSHLLHHKWAYIDGKEIILGSTNWTKAAFTKNQDCLLFIKDLTTKQKRFFEKLQKTIVVESTDTL